MTPNTATTATLESPLERIAQRRAIRAANLRRMAKCAADWADSSESDYWQLRFLDALSFVIEGDIFEEIEILRAELRIDAEGYPLDDDGFPRLGADRFYMPLPKLEAQSIPLKTEAL